MTKFVVRTPDLEGVRLFCWFCSSHIPLEEVHFPEGISLDDLLVSPEQAGSETAAEASHGDGKQPQLPRASVSSSQLASPGPPATKDLDNLKAPTSIIAIPQTSSASIVDIISHNRRVLEQALQAKLELARTGNRDYRLTAEDAEAAVACAVSGEIPRELGMALGFLFSLSEAERASAARKQVQGASTIGGEERDSPGPVDLRLVKIASGDAGKHPGPSGKNDKKNQSLMERMLSVSPEHMVGFQDVFCARAQVLAPLKAALGPSWAEVEESMGAKHDLRIKNPDEEGPTLGSFVAPDGNDRDLSAFSLASLMPSKAKTAKATSKASAPFGIRS
eukprot:tig00021535_g22227.t1